MPHIHEEAAVQTFCGRANPTPRSSRTSGSQEYPSGTEEKKRPTDQGKEGPDYSMICFLNLYVLDNLLGAQ